MLSAALSVVIVLWLVRAVNVMLSWILIPKLPAARRRGSGAPFVSVIVPARNEERDIGAATRSKLLLDDPAFEVVVVDDRSTDGTRRVLAELAREFPGRLVVLDGVEPPEGLLGKPHALVQGAAAARARDPHDWLVFSDADVHYEPDLLSGCFAHIDSERLQFLSLLPTLLAPSFGEQLMVSSVVTYGTCYLPGWLMNVKGARLFGGGSGVFNAIRRDLYDRIGGHEALAQSIVDDVQLGRNARLAGARTGLAFALDALRIRMYHSFAETVRGFGKNGFFGIGGNVPLAAAMLVFSLLEGVVPWAVFAAPVVGLGPGPGTETWRLAALSIGLTFLVRGALNLRMGYALWPILLHPVWTAAIVGIFGRSTWINGVLHRNEWRGRVRDARGLRF